MWLALRNRWRGAAVTLGLLIAALYAVSSVVQATPEKTVGLFQNDEGSSAGYTLFSSGYPVTYLIDNDGRLVHSWSSRGVSEYLLEDGSLIQTTFVSNPTISGGGATGGVTQLAWDGSPVWEFEYSSPDYRLHHDVEVLPNGNVLMIVWQNKTSAEAIAAGRDPALLSDGVLFPEQIIEVEPTGATTGNIVWSWSMWDHLVQDFDATKDNFGVVGDYPELIDINYFDANQGDEDDWIHMNAVDYNEAFDQILLSARDVSEVWVIDHSTTTAEAASHAGGDSGKGGDLLYRWGNPQAYRAGVAGDQELFLQHDVQWIDPGLPGAGNILVFNNGDGRPAGEYSSVDEIAPPVDVNGNYALTPGQAYGPAALTWTYVAPTPTDFWSRRQSGADRLPDGNTLMNEGLKGTFTEVTSAGTIVWKYVNPVVAQGPVAQGVPPVGNSVFRAHRYAPEFPGFAGKGLTPGWTIEIVDSDKDGLSDQEEGKTYGTDALDSDTDDDGCADGAEILLAVEQGGERDPLNPYDFYDVLGPGAALPLDGVIDLPNDLLGVILQFGHNCV